MYKYIFLLLLTTALYAGGQAEISKDVLSDTCKASVLLQYDFNIHKIILTPFTQYTSYFNHGSLFANHPYRDIFETGLNIAYKNIYIKYQHICSHAVSSYNNHATPMISYYQEPNSSANFITVGYKWGSD